MMEYKNTTFDRLRRNIFGTREDSIKSKIQNYFNGSINLHTPPQLIHIIFDNLNVLSDAWGGKIFLCSLLRKLMACWDVSWFIMLQEWSSKKFWKCIDRPADGYLKTVCTDYKQSDLAGKAGYHPNFTVLWFIFCFGFLGWVEQIYQMYSGIQGWNWVTSK